MHRNKLAAMATRLALMLVMALAIGVAVAEERDLQPEVSVYRHPVKMTPWGPTQEPRPHWRRWHVRLHAHRTNLLARLNARTA